MPGPFVVPFHGDVELPEKVDVVVIGGGIIGVATTLELAEAGLSVALCEKGSIGCEQSSRNWGWVRISCRDVREIPLMAEAIPIWQSLAERLGCDVGYRQIGVHFTHSTRRQREDNERFTQELENSPFAARLISAQEFHDLVPGAKLDVGGALYNVHDGRAEPQKVAPAFASAARARGAHILTECAVRGVEREAGRICGVVTERGLIKCQSVVLAGGAWSSLFLGQHGIRLPQLKVMNSVLSTKPVEGGPEQTVWATHFAMRKRQDGGYTISSGHESIVNIVPKSFSYARNFFPALRASWRALKFHIGMDFLTEMTMPNHWSLDEASPFEYVRVLDPKPSRKLTDRAYAHAKRAFPILENVAIAQRWGGYMDVSPDAVPIISPLEQIPGLFVATGFSGHGFGIGPAAGRLMADLVLGRKPVVDTKPFRFERFSDGSKIEVMGGF